MPNVGPLELVVVLVIALVVLGPKKLPEVGRSLGHGIREFKDSLSGMGQPDEDEPLEVEEPPKAVTTAAAAAPAGPDSPEAPDEADAPRS